MHSESFIVYNSDVRAKTPDYITELRAAFKVVVRAINYLVNWRLHQMLLMPYNWETLRQNEDFTSTLQSGDGCNQEAATKFWICEAVVGVRGRVLNFAHVVQEKGHAGTGRALSQRDV